ncbi:hypothetical protein BD309DRAFT_955169 [Dichomitus squalens]|nr:hypothetical protein BD309DRAFT_955169 [Dichomitus squalens]
MFEPSCSPLILRHEVSQLLSSLMVECSFWIWNTPVTRWSPPEVDLLTAENRPFGHKFFVGVARPSPVRCQYPILPQFHSCDVLPEASPLPWFAGGSRSIGSCGDGRTWMRSSTYCFYRVRLRSSLHCPLVGCCVVSLVVSSSHALSACLCIFAYSFNIYLDYSRRSSRRCRHRL